MTKSRGILTPKKKWREEELELLRARYADTTAAEIAVQIGCKLHVVHKKAQNLGLHKSEEFRRSAKSGKLMPGSKVHDRLQPHQAAIVQWAVRGGRRAIFIQVETISGKTVSRSVKATSLKATVMATSSIVDLYAEERVSESWDTQQKSRQTRS